MMTRNSETRKKKIMNHLVHFEETQKNTPVVSVKKIPIPDTHIPKKVI